MVRIEIPKDAKPQYDKLHKEMEQRNFLKTVKVHGIVYNLPDAMYLIETDRLLSEVMVMAKSAVSDANRDSTVKPLIVVCQSAGIEVDSLTSPQSAFERLAILLGVHPGDS